MLTRPVMTSGSPEPPDGTSCVASTVAVCDEKTSTNPTGKSSALSASSSIRYSYSSSQIPTKGPYETNPGPSSAVAVRTGPSIAPMSPGSSAPAQVNGRSSS